MADDLSSAGKLAKAWDVPPKKVKEAIEKTKVEPDVVKSGCNYYAPETAEKLKQRWNPNLRRTLCVGLFCA